MNRRRFLQAACMSLALAALAVTAQGCSNSQGRQLAPGSTTSPDLVMKNRSPNTIHVYVDGGEVGQVPAGANGKFQVLSGTHRVDVRERGNSLRHSFGDIIFGFVEVELTYRP